MEKVLKNFIKDFPMTSKDKRELISLFKSNKDYLKGLSKEEKEEYMAKTSYKKILRRKSKIIPKSYNIFRGNDG